MTCDGTPRGWRSAAGAASARHTAYSATTVLPLLVGALTSTPRWVSSFCSASTWKSSREKGRVAANASTRGSPAAARAGMLMRG